MIHRIEYLLSLDLRVLCVDTKGTSVISRAPISGLVLRYVHELEIVKVVETATTDHAYKHYRSNVLSIPIAERRALKLPSFVFVVIGFGEETGRRELIHTTRLCQQPPSCGHRVYRVPAWTDSFPCIG